MSASCGAPLCRQATYQAASSFAKASEEEKGQGRDFLTHEEFIDALVRIAWHLYKDIVPPEQGPADAFEQLMLHNVGPNVQVRVPGYFMGPCLHASVLMHRFICTPSSRVAAHHRTQRSPRGGAPR